MDNNSGLNIRNSCRAFIFLLCFVYVCSTCFSFLYRGRNLPGHLPGLHPHGLQRPGQAEPLPAVRPSETLMLRRRRTSKKKQQQQLRVWSDVDFPCRIIRKESHVTSSFCKSLVALWSTEWGKKKPPHSFVCFSVWPSCCQRMVQC